MAEGDEPMGSKSPSSTSSTKAGNEEDYFMPDKPIMGGIEQTGPLTYTAWTGGKPKANWEGLEDPNPKSKTPNQYRATSISSEAKSRVYRTKGLETKFSKKGDFPQFQRRLKKHLETYGMDTICYVQDPTDSDQMINVIDKYARYSLRDGIDAGNDAMNLFDQYDTANSKDAIEFLLNSLDDDLEKKLSGYNTEGYSFVAYWFRFIHCIKSVSIERFEKIRTRIRNRKLSQYASENIEDLCRDYMADHKELHEACQYHPNLTMVMLNEIMLAGGSKEEFRHPLYEIKLTLNNALMNVSQMEYDAAHQHLHDQGLDVETLLEAIQDRYRILYDDGQWPAASHAVDSKALNKNFGSVNKTTVTPSEQEQFKKMINALVQTMHNSDSSRFNKLFNPHEGLLSEILSFGFKFCKLTSSPR